MPHFLLLASGVPVLRNGDVHYPFRVDSDFLAWTGLDIEGVVLLHDLQTDEQILFFDEIDDQKRIWESMKWDTTTIRSHGFTGQILPRGEMSRYLESLDGDFLLPENPLPSTLSDYQVIGEILAGRQISSADRYLIQKRLIKSSRDIEKIQGAIEITEKTYSYLIQNVRPSMYEYEVEAMIAYQFRLHHGTEAFPSIVASGPSACTLHYTAHDRQIQSGDLILIDFGIELDGYGADISRTFAVDGQMHPRQQVLYDAVLEVKRYAESTLRPGITQKEWNLLVKDYMFEMCKKLELKNIEQYTPTTNPYFPHSIGHYLGLDTHDVGGPDIPLMPGMVLTIEPGLYISEEGIGIRVEDDYVVTSTGCERISAKDLIS